MKLRLQSLHVLGAGDVAYCLASLIESLVEINERFLLRTRCPKLYGSGVRYEESDEWHDVPALLSSRLGDCKSLAAWRLAELRREGEMSTPHIVRRQRPGEILFHVQVRRCFGEIEDPSRILGMSE